MPNVVRHPYNHSHPNLLPQKDSPMPLQYFTGPSAADPKTWLIFRCSFTPTSRTHSHLATHCFGPFHTAQDALLAARNQFAGHIKEIQLPQEGFAPDTHDEQPSPDRAHTSQRTLLEGGSRPQ